MIELDRVRKLYGEIVAVNDLSLTVRAGELVVLLGESGCGKTTTLKLINRLIEPTSGSVSIAGRSTTDVPGHQLRRGIGYCFQETGLFPHMSVGKNVAVTLDLLGWGDADQERRVAEMLRLVGLEPETFAGRQPSKLSGGQRQRVGIARALAASPDILLMDEPFGALDPLTRHQLQRSFQKLRGSLELTAVFVTHDMVEALLLGDRIAVMDRGQLVQLGTPHQLLAEPATDYVVRLMETPRRQAEQVDALIAGDSTS